MHVLRRSVEPPPEADIATFRSRERDQGFQMWARD